MRIACLWILLGCARAATEIAYVLEPFENEPEYNAGNIELSGAALSSDALFGNGSHAILFSDDLTETRRLGLRLTSGVEGYNCWGSERLSLWYKIIKDEPEVLSNASLAIALTTNHNVTFETNATALVDRLEGEWTEHVWKWGDFEPRTLDASSDVREKLVPNHIREWHLSIGATDGTTILVDHLSCAGDRLLEAPFLDDTTFLLGPSPSRSTWAYRSHESPLSLNHTNVQASNLSLYFDYLLEQTASWGGNFRMDHTAPANAYFNLSGADSIRLPYHVTKTASPPERPHLRLILLDDKGCVDSCSAATELENFYSFHYVLSNLNEVEEKTSIAIPLVGDDDGSSPVTFTGWYGKRRNAVLDKEYIKGFSLEISIDGAGKIGSTASGSFGAGPLQVGGPLPPKPNASCTFEPELMVVNANSFKLVHYEQDCCLRCEMEEDCHFAVSISSGRDCMVAASVAPDEVGLIRTAEQAQVQRFHIMSNSLNWCDVCLCDISSHAIDCRGRDLVTLPSVFDEEWDVQNIDLSYNARLVVIGDSLARFGQSLKYLRLPHNLKHLSPSSSSKLSVLKRIEKENIVDFAPVRANFVTTRVESFDNVCCSPQPFTSGQNKANSEHLSCNMTREQIGDDTVYEPFAEYIHTIQSQYIRTTSTFMAEAAESPEKCAEYCHVQSECRYFTFDTRVNNAGNTCILIADKYAEPAIRCCGEANQYADRNRTSPGYVSGRTPRARASNDNAKVQVALTNGIIDKQSSYHGTFEISLGNTPMRGAVWIDPYVSSESSATVSFEPSRVVLYTAEESYTVTVQVSGVELGSKESLVVGNRVTSCDTAFSSLLEETKLNVVMSIIGDTPRSRTMLISSLIVICMFALSTLFILAFVQKEKRKRLEDQVWKIDVDELHFPNPKVVLGRGTFGMVLLAEFRGTEVAVKQVLPTKSSKTEIGRVARDIAEASAAFRAGGGSTTSRASTHYLKNGKLSSHVDPNSEGASSIQLKQDFLEEMRQLSMLRHPCITTVMGAVIDSKAEPLLIMERMEHGSLYNLLHNETFALEGEQLLHILRDIAQGVRFLHASTPEVLHGDLKAQNILVDAKFRAKVADFGLSQKKNLGAVGTPFWMAPELLLGEACNSKASDVFSFGIILYEVYSRKEPYAEIAMDFPTLIRYVIDPVIAHRPVMPQNSPETIKAMMKDCVRHHPDQRPSFEEIDLELQRVNAETVAPVVNTKQNTERLLFDIFPRDVAERLRDGRRVEPKHCDLVTIFFSDIVGFTNISSSLSPLKISDMLGRLYSKLDELLATFDVFKVETIGDAYMAVTNLAKDQSYDHAKRIADFAVAAIAAAHTTLIDVDDPERGYVQIRVGFHSGPVVASVVGTRNPRYCLFGDTVNVASRMESSSEVNRIHCSEPAALLVQTQHATMPVTERGLITVKGKGEMRTFWVNDTSVKTVVKPDEVPTPSPVLPSVEEA